MKNCELAVAGLVLSLGVGGVMGLGGCAPTASRSATQPHEMSIAESQAILEKAVAILQDQFRNPDAAIRANCLEALQNLRDKRAVSMFELGLHDEAWVVRFAAALAAGRQQATPLKQTLQQMYGRETNENVKVGISFALQRLGDDTRMTHLAVTMKSPDPGVRANTALVLGLLVEKSAFKVLRPARRDTDERVRFEITAAMARLGDMEAEDAILAMSINRFAEANYMALAACPDINRAEVDNVLWRGLHMRDEFKNPKPEEKYVLDRTTLIAARGTVRRGNLTPTLGLLVLEYSRSPEPEMRALAALALGEMLYPPEEAPLKRLMEDPDVKVKVAAAAGTINVAVRAAKGSSLK